MVWVACFAATAGRRGRRVDQIGLACHHLGSKRWEPLLPVVGICAVVGDVLPFNPAEFAHLVEEGLERNFLLRLRAGGEHADATQAALGGLRSQQGRLTTEAGT